MGEIVIGSQFDISFSFSRAVHNDKSKIEDSFFLLLFLRKIPSVYSFYTLLVIHFQIVHILRQSTGTRLSDIDVGGTWRKEAKCARRYSFFHNWQRLTLFSVVN